MAVEDPSAIPAIFDSIDDVLVREAELLVETDVQTDEALAFGRSLSFDWSRMQMRLDASGQPVVVSGQAALVEDIVKALLTPRFLGGVYDSDYGSEFDQLIGLPAAVVITQVEEMVRECLLIDDRISAIENVTVSLLRADSVRVRIDVRDFNGEPLDVPEVLIRYAG